MKYNNNDHRGNATLQWNHHVTKTLLVLFVVLMVFRVPHFIIHIVNDKFDIPIIWMVFHQLFYIRYCIEPLIYVIISSTYRQEFSDFIQKIFSKHNQIQIQNDDFRY